MATKMLLPREEILGGKVSVELFEPETPVSFKDRKGHLCRAVFLRIDDSRQIEHYALFAVRSRGGKDSIRILHPEIEGRNVGSGYIDFNDRSLFYRSTEICSAHDSSNTNFNHYDEILRRHNL